MITALGLNTIQPATENEMTASVYDAHTGRVVAENVKGEAGEFVSLIPPEIDIEADSMSGLSAGWDESTKRFMLVRKEVYRALVHIKHTGMVFQAGARMNASIGGVSSDDLGLGGVSVLTRELAERGMEAVDRAIRRVSAERSGVGVKSGILEADVEYLAVAGAEAVGASDRVIGGDMAELAGQYFREKVLRDTAVNVFMQTLNTQNVQSVLSLSR